MKREKGYNGLAKVSQRIACYFGAHTVAVLEIERTETVNNKAS